jgi:hypothetical protein
MTFLGTFAFTGQCRNIEVCRDIWLKKQECPGPGDFHAFSKEITRDSTHMF